ncbi:MAG TPA: N-6 DNA methylase [Candidatus Paceibacterota bacterium]
MLTQEIKKKIDSARNILVGKVSDPKAQVEQITTALIYKFMDDMDKQAASLPKGKVRFFINGYGKYAWSKMMDAKLGGQERLNLYVEAITKMSKNPNLPQLFRDVFKDAVLPYRDPETLNLFLKEINGFTYDHSENLGDAYEYLLSILSVQGDIGSLRTPRHIIDFIVEVVDPKKDESILDPACGTAGFLISAYKHILQSNKNKPLTPDEKKRLMNNLTGYDISPDMVKLSLVNMYLHGFPSPNIHEYDTLTGEEKWGERFDVMMANPPFMSPTGGIRPHKRFMVQATRAELLFVDYIVEHLNNHGRGGVIVPEGVGANPDNSYRQLRKLLVQDGLYAVVSLPSGVFNPYSGIRTHILFFDNQLSKQSKDILFVKVSNDGFDLGAQRRPIDKNDLSRAIEVLHAQQEAIKNGKKNSLLKKDELFVWTISKKEILDNENYSLSGDSYRAKEKHSSSKWTMTELHDVLDYEQPTPYIVKSVEYDDAHATPVLTAGKTFILGYTNEKEGIFKKEKLPVIIFDDFTTSMKFVDFPFKVKSSAMKILHAKKDKADIRFLFYAMQRVHFAPYKHKRHWISEYSKIKIPLPPLSVQKEIVAKITNDEQQISALKKEIESRKKEIELKIAEVWGE